MADIKCIKVTQCLGVKPRIRVYIRVAFSFGINGISDLQSGY